LIRVEPPPTARRSRPVVVRTGEVVGLAGLVGAGRTEWAWRLVGAAPGQGERVFVRGQEVRIASPRHARDLGIGMVPEDRKGHGLILLRTVRDNITLTVLDRLCRWGGWLDGQRQAQLSRQYVDRFRIRCPHDGVGADTLSGGNQQKVVLAKWLARGCEAIILDEPTRGIDVGAKFEMYTLINELSGQGKAVVLISSDLPELMSMSDRLYVMHQGDVVAEVDARRTSQEEVMHFASGYFEHAAA
jgi:ribose transport system ATP-binding protein